MRTLFVQVEKENENGGMVSKFGDLGNSVNPKDIVIACLSVIGNFINHIPDKEDYRDKVENYIFDTLAQVKTQYKNGQAVTSN